MGLGVRRGGFSQLGLEPTTRPNSSSSETVEDSTSVVTLRENYMTSALRALALTASLVCTAMMAPAQAAAPIDLQPEDLTRGADIGIAHIEDGDFVLGARTVEVGGERAYLLGKAGKAWLVGTSDANGTDKLRIVRVEADDTTTVIKRGISFFELKLSENGRYFVHSGRAGKSGIPITVFSSRTGEAKVKKVFPSYPEVFGMDGPRVLISSWSSPGRGVRWWNTTTGTITQVTKRTANYVDIGNDLFATYSKDPHLGGCVVLSKLSDLTTRLWKSCGERIEAISPDGARMATVHILSDGIGPSAVWEREIDGTVLGDYTTNWFGRIGFEDNLDLLLDVNGDTRAATVRCREGSCENATDPVAVQDPRLSVRPHARRFAPTASTPGAW